jgi:hypothetical protein
MTVRKEPTHKESQKSKWTQKASAFESSKKQNWNAIR